MVRDGIYYALALSAGGALIAYLSGPWFAGPLFLAAIFCLNFFRDPDREVPPGPVAVSPADGKVVAVTRESAVCTRVSIFLNIFDVHVNRTADLRQDRASQLSSREVSGRAQRGSLFAEDEQNTITVEGDGVRVTFSQIAGLIARRIVCYKKPGATRSRPERESASSSSVRGRTSNWAPSGKSW
jgi:phosphatidylserine decarboxylase